MPWLQSFCIRSICILHSCTFSFLSFLVPRSFPQQDWFVTSPAKVIAQPNPNKAAASAKQGALHKKKVMSAGDADRRHSVFGEFECACRVHTPPACVNVAFVCHSGPGGHRQTVYGGLRKLFEVISRESLAKGAALPGGEWHHGIKRSASVQPARFWMTGDLNTYVQAVWGPNEQIMIRELSPPLSVSHTHNKKQTQDKKQMKVG